MFQTSKGWCLKRLFHKKMGQKPFRVDLSDVIIFVPASVSDVKKTHFLSWFRHFFERVSTPAEFYFYLGRYYHLLDLPTQSVIAYEYAISQCSDKKLLSKLNTFLLHLCLDFKLYPKAIVLLQKKCDRFLFIRLPVLKWTNRICRYIFHKDLDAFTCINHVLFQLTYLLREQKKFEKALYYAHHLARLSNQISYRYLLFTIHEGMNHYSEVAKLSEQMQLSSEHVNLECYESLYSQIRKTSL